MADFAQKPAYEIARRLEVRGQQSYSWFILIAPPGEGEAGVEPFAEELEAFLGREPRVLDITGFLVDDLRSKLQDPPDDPVILLGFNERSGEFWSSIDVNRSGLERSGGIIFWLSAKGVSELCTYAPNVRSFVGGSIFVVGREGSEMSPEERRGRLRDLAAYFRMNDDEVIRLAEARKLPAEPEFVEWLVLLGRGDLV